MSVRRSLSTLVLSGLAGSVVAIVVAVSTIEWPCRMVCCNSLRPIPITVSVLGISVVQWEDTDENLHAAQVLSNAILAYTLFAGALNGIAIGTVILNRRPKRYETL